jgi:hypothetical protein
VDDNRKFLTALIVCVCVCCCCCCCCLIYLTIENEEGVVYEEDTEDDEDYVWVDHFELAEDGSSVETKEKVVGDEESPISDEHDPYDYVYSSLSDDVHVLKPIDDYKKVWC